VCPRGHPPVAVSNTWDATRTALRCVLRVCLSQSSLLRTCEDGWLRACRLTFATVRTQGSVSLKFLWLLAAKREILRCFNVTRMNLKIFVVYTPKVYVSYVCFLAILRRRRIFWNFRHISKFEKRWTSKSLEATRSNYATFN